jgi:hypothetical protein
MKKHVWIPAAGVVLLTVAMMGRPSLESPKPRVRPRSERLRAQERPRIDPPPMEVRDPQPEARIPEPAETAPAAPPRESTMSPPEWVDDDSGRMRTWLLGLSNEELARVVGTPQLSGWVSLALAGLSGPQASSNEPPLEHGEFLAKLNVRILAVQGK